MPHTWSRLHEHLGCPPGPIDFAMVRQCVADKLGEADDLDWKEDLPNAQNPNTAVEFAKDVAAMANTRGGLIVYGVTDDVTFKGVQVADVHPDQYAQWVRNLVQPYLSGLEQYVLPSDDGAFVFVVDIPASELAPHSVDFVDIRDKDKAKSQHATVTPYRDGPHTAWMAEHQIARAYAERLTRAAQWQESFNELRDWAAESLEGRAEPGNAWLVVVARPTRLIPRSAPRLDREVAMRIVDDARTNPVMTFEPREPVIKLLGNGLGRITVGLNAWVVTNRVGEGAQGPREVSVEFHHDGSLVFVVNLSQHTLHETDRPFPKRGIVNVDVVEQACVDLEALLLQAVRAERIDSPMRVQASVVSEEGMPLVYAMHETVDYKLAEGSRGLRRLRPITVEVPVGATEAHTHVAAAELAAGILNQFGIGCRLNRYIT